MKNSKNVGLFIGLSCLFLSCFSPKVVTELKVKNLDPLSENEEIYLLEIGDTIPEGGVWVGRMYVGNRNTSKNCTCQEELELAKKEIGKYGANVGRIISINRVSEYNNCLKLFINMYRVEETDIDKMLNQNYECQLGEDVEHANIYFIHDSYRIWDIPIKADISKIKIYDGKQKEYCQLKQGERCHIVTESFGLQKIILFDSNIKEEFEVDIQKGCDYYFEVKYLKKNQGGLILKLDMTDLGAKNGRKYYQKYQDHQ